MPGGGGHVNPLVAAGIDGRSSLTNSTVARVGVLDEPWADRHERRLRTKLSRRLPAGETLRDAAIVFTGPGPNLEGLAEDVLGRGLLRRKYFTIALTDRRLLLITNIGENSPDKIVHEYRDVTAIEGLNTIDGDTWISVGGKRYWYWPPWSKQVTAIANGRTESEAE